LGEWHNLLYRYLDPLCPLHSDDSEHGEQLDDGPPGDPADEHLQPLREAVGTLRHQVAELQRRVAELEGATTAQAEPRVLVRWGKWEVAL
jgi:hypothetical protein